MARHDKTAKPQFKYESSLDKTEEQKRDERRSMLKTSMEMAHSFTYPGFANTQPYFMEKPSLYVKRMQLAADQLLIVPDDDANGGKYGRIVYSPMLSLPSFILWEGDQITKNAENYPYLHAPSNHTYKNELVKDPNLDYETWMLAVMIAYSSAFMNYADITPAGDIQTWDDVENNGHYQVPDSAWDVILDTAKNLGPQIALVNEARLIEQADTHEELEQAKNLMGAWQISKTPQQIIHDAYDAAAMLEPYMTEILYPDRPYDPIKAWSDNHTDTSEQQEPVQATAAQSE